MSNAITLTIDIQNDNPMTNWKARFQLGRFFWDFSDLTQRPLSVIITEGQASEFPIGTSYGALTLYDEVGRAMTVMRRVPVKFGQN